MPYKIRKVRNKSCYKVYKPKTKKVFAKCSTLENAKKQVRLLTAIENNAVFRKKTITSNKTRKNRK
jgi:hypothetical protein